MTLEKAQDLLAQSANTVCFSGAGLSAESGIATFRDSETHALWSRYDPTELASPEGFSKHPKTVIDWYNWRRAAVAKAQPNPAHHALAAQPQMLQITQNVDDLLERAGCATENVVHLHGVINQDHCHCRCGHHEAVDMKEGSRQRKCPHCGGTMRPAVVWFGETLPEQDWARAQDHCQQAQCLLVIGTSAVVYPAASLIQYTKSHGGKVIIINTQASGASHLADVELIGPCGEILPQLLS